MIRRACVCVCARVRARVRVCDGANGGATAVCTGVIVCTKCVLLASFPHTAGRGRSLQGASPLVHCYTGDTNTHRTGIQRSCDGVTCPPGVRISPNNKLQLFQ